MKKIFYIAVLIAISINLHAQEEKQTIDLNIHEFSFIKDNEYFSYIADGYTLLGTYLLPEIDYVPHHGFHLKTGIFLHRYWGADTLNVAYPFMQMEYISGRSTFRMGSMRNTDNHGLIAPLMGIENTLTRSALESGVQYLFVGDKMQLDVSVNWKRFIFKKSPFQEEIFHALVWRYNWLNKKKWRADFRLQNTIYHRGGQINTTNASNGMVFTMLHTSTGSVFYRDLGRNGFAYLDAYFIRYAAQTVPREYLYNRGYAWYSHLGIAYRNFDFKIGFWYGYHFVSPYGDEMYQSVSHVTGTAYNQNAPSELHTGFNDPNRNLLLIGLKYEKNLFKGLKIRMKANVFYRDAYTQPIPYNSADPTPNFWDYSFGLYISYNGSLHLWDNTK